MTTKTQSTTETAPICLLEKSFNRGYLLFYWPCKFLIMKAVSNERSHLTETNIVTEIFLSVAQRRKHLVMT